MIMRFVPGVEALEPDALAALQDAFSRLKASLTQRTEQDEQALAHALWASVSAGASVDEAERAAARRFAERQP